MGNYLFYFADSLKSLVFNNYLQYTLTVMKVVSSRKHPLVRNVLSFKLPNLSCEQVKIMLTQEDIRPVKLHEEKQFKFKCKKFNKKEKKSALSVVDRNWSYKECKKMHYLWLGYMKNLIKETDPNTNTLQELLLKADFHGAYLRVVQSKCNSFKNLQGIVMMESKNIFQIITVTNKIIKIPKKNSIFEVQYMKYRITIFGDQFCIKPGFRLIKKFNKYVNTLALV